MTFQTLRGMFYEQMNQKWKFGGYRDIILSDRNQTLLHKKPIQTVKNGESNVIVWEWLAALGPEQVAIIDKRIS